MSTMRRMHTEKEIQKQALEPSALIGAIEAGNGIVVDESEDGTKTEIHLDQDIEVSSVTAEEITGDSIVEKMSGYSMSESAHAEYTLNLYYVGAVKNGNKITFSVFGTITKASGAGAFINVIDIYIPKAIGQKLYPVTLGSTATLLDVKTIGFALDFATSVNCPMWLNKISNTNLRLGLNATNLVAGNAYLFRYEVTFLLSDNLASDNG